MAESLPVQPSKGFKIAGIGQQEIGKTLDRATAVVAL